MCWNNPTEFSAKIKTEGKEESWGEGEQSDAWGGKQITCVHPGGDHDGWETLLKLKLHLQTWNILILTDTEESFCW